MKVFRYRVFYDFLGPSHSDPFDSSPKTKDEISFSLERFPAELEGRLSNDCLVEATDLESDAVFIQIHSDLPKIEIDRAIQESLNDWRLLAERC